MFLVVWAVVRVCESVRGVSECAAVGHKMRSKTAPAGRPVGPPRGGSCYLECLRAFREVFGIPYSAAVRRAVWSYYQDKCFIMPDSSPAPGAGAVAPDSRKDAPALEG